MKLRIVTYNIHKGVSTLGSRPRIHALKQALTGLQADIVFLQEVQGRHDLLALRHSGRWPSQGQHEYLACSPAFRLRPLSIMMYPIMRLNRVAFCTAC